MASNHPYPYRHVTPEEIQALIRRAHVERALAARELLRALFRRKPAADNATNVPSLDAAAACH
jgi:hypothetical protein